jgi:hypothetical protein
MAINFPNSPVHGTTYEYQGTTYRFELTTGSVGYWKVHLPIPSGLATPTEIDAGSEPIKYITPEALALSKYNRSESDFQILVSNPARVIRTTGRTYLNPVDDTNSRDNATDPHTVYGNTPSPHISIGSPIVFHKDCKITKITLIAEKAATMATNPQQGDGSYLPHDILLRVVKYDYETSGSSSALIYMNVDDPSLVAEYNDVFRDGDPLNVDTAPNEDKYIFSETIPAWSGISIDNTRHCVGVSFVPRFEAQNVSALLNYSILIEGVDL